MKKVFCTKQAPAQRLFWQPIEVISLVKITKPLYNVCCTAASILGRQ